MTTEPKFTQSMTMHLNGGNKFSELHYDVERDGAPTKIKRYTRTSGRPRYVKTDDFFACGDARFDILETKGVGMAAWLAEHSAPSSVSETATPQESADASTPPAEQPSSGVSRAEPSPVNSEDPNVRCS